MDGKLIILDKDHLFTFFASTVSLSLFFAPGVVSVSMIAFVVYALLQRFIARNKLWDNIREHWILLTPMGLFLLYTIWISVADDKAVAYSEVVKKAGLFLFPLAFLLIDRPTNERTMQTVLVAFAVGCVVVSFVCYGYAIYRIYDIGTIYNYEKDRTEYFFTYYSLTEISSIQPIYLAMYANFAFAISLTTKLVKPWLKYLFAAYLAVFVILIASKIGIMVLVAICVLWIITSIQKYRAVYALCTIAIALLIVLKIPFFRERFQVTTTIDWQQLDTRLWSSATFRVAIWTCALDAIKGSPAIGYGTANGNIALYRVYEQRQFGRGLYDKYNPHNELLTTQLDLGIPGTIVFLAMFIVPFLPPSGRINSLLLSFLIISFGTMFTESILVRQKGIIFFAFFYSLVLYLTHPVWPSRKINY